MYRRGGGYGRRGYGGGWRRGGWGYRRPYGGMRPMWRPGLFWGMRPFWGGWGWRGGGCCGMFALLFVIVGLVSVGGLVHLL